MPTLNAPRAARVVVDSAYLGDKAAAEKHGVSTRTVRRYRERCDSDPKLAAFVRIEAGRREAEWAADLTPAIAAGADFLRRACEEADPSKAENITAVGEALAKLAEVKIAAALVRSRVARPDGPEVVTLA